VNRVSLGHHFILSCRAGTLSSEERDLFREVRPVGVFLWRNSFAKDLGYPGWCGRLTDLLAELRELTGREKMIVCIDHEGGRVTVAPKPITVTPAAGEFAPYAGLVGRIHGAELSSIGVNLTFGPVLDIFSNPSNPVIGPRSFGGDAAAVTAAAQEYISAIRAAGVAVCPKHFPGHGDVSADTHFGFASVSADANTIRERELSPFRELIRRAKLGAIMTAHVSFPAIDPHFPATLSRTFLHDVLRQELGFQGVIVSDDVDMAALRANYTDEDCPRLLRQAGVDLILFNHHPERARTFVHVLEQGLRTGTLSLKEEQESLARVDAFVGSLPSSVVSHKSEEFFASHRVKLAEAAAPPASSVLLLSQEPRPRRVSPPNGPFDVRVGIVIEGDERKEITFTPEFDSPGRASNGAQFVFAAGQHYTVRVEDHELALDGGSYRNEKIVGILKVSHPAGSERRSGAGIRVSPLVAGRHFHWKKEIEGAFCGAVEIHPAQDRLIVVNAVDFETYLACVVGSEMSGRGLPVEFSKAQATAARSWAYTFLGTKYPGKPYLVCNDDMSQRYQGTTFLEQALFDDLEPCRGKYLVDAEGCVVPAYYSKSTGGHGELPDDVFGFAVAGIGASYDCPIANAPALNLSSDTDFVAWLNDDGWRGRGIFCSPEVVSDEELSKFLGAVDAVTNYFRWEYKISAEQVVQNLRTKCGVPDIERICEIRWGKRGVSGRFLAATVIYRSVDGALKYLSLPNQFAIRGCFHESFLFSSAFTAEQIREGDYLSELRFRGAGWGHGVGLCQIGALGMALGREGVYNPFSYEEILAHYFKGSVLKGAPAEDRST
jgi:beta-N-acetylhexosaminidase